MALWLAMAALALQAPPADRPCTAQEQRDLTTPSDQPYRLRCRAQLSGADVRRRVLIEGDTKQINCLYQDAKFYTHADGPDETPPAILQSARRVVAALEKVGFK